MNRRKIAAMVIFALCVVLVSYFFLGGTDTNNLIIYTVTPGKFVRKISTTGTVKIKDEVVLRAGVKSQVKEILVSDGQLVKKGQVLIRLDDEAYRDAVAAADLCVISAKNHLVQRQKEYIASKLSLRLEKNKSSLAKTVLEDAMLNRVRNRGLFEQNVLSQKNLDDSELALENAEIGQSLASINLELAENNLDSSKNNIQTAEAELENALIIKKEAERNFEKTQIISPIDGVAFNKVVDEGVSVQIGSPLLSIGNSDFLIVELEVDEEDISEIEINQKAELEIESKTMPRFHGTVYEIAPNAENQSNVKYFLVKVSLNDDYQFLKLGMSVDAEILTIVKSNVLTVPLIAVVRDQIFGKTRNSLFVVSKKNVIEKVEIDLGADNNSEVIVINGVSPGTRIVVGDFDQINRLKAKYKSD